MSEVAMVILSAAVGALAGIVTTAWKSRKDLEAQYDIDLRKRRVDAYTELWKVLEPLAHYFEATEITRARAEDLGKALRRWYYGAGGLVLSSDSRPAYFNLQQALRGVATSPADRWEPIPDADHEILKALASRLRTSTTVDVATRLGPRLGPSLAARLARPWRRRLAPVRIVVDRRWAWTGGSARPALFVIVENQTDGELEVAGVDVPEIGRIAGRFRLQRGEDRELQAATTAPVAGVIAPEVTVELASGKRISGGSPPAVPLRSDLVAPG